MSYRIMILLIILIIGTVLGIIGHKYFLIPLIGLPLYVGYLTSKNLKDYLKSFVGIFFFGLIGWYFLGLFGFILVLYSLSGIGLYQSNKFS